MSRLLIGAAFGLVVGVVAGAAVGLHAEDTSRDVKDVAAAAGYDEIELAGAVISTGVDPYTYARWEGRLAPLPPPKLSVPSWPWDALAQCESTSNWHANTGNGFYGGIQFDYGTWLRHGGAAFAPRADMATREQQIIVGQRTLAVQGFGAWPACSRKLGLR